MGGRTYKALVVLFAALVQFVPPDLTPRLVNVETSNQHYSALLVDVALPAAQTSVVTFRAQRTWVSVAGNHNAYWVVTTGLSAVPRFECYRRSEPGLIHRFQPQTSLCDCDRAPPQAAFATLT